MENKRIPRKTKKNRKKQIIFWCMNIVFLIVTVFIIKFAFTKLYSVAKDFTSGNSTASSSNVRDGSITVEIPEGSGTATIAKLLKENDLISSELIFRAKSRMNDFDGTYRFGTYDIPYSFTEEEIMVLLQEGGIDKDLIKITIPEGYTIQKIAALLSEKGIMEEQTFIDAANSIDYDYDFVKQIPERDNRLEGYLFPDTYHFKAGVDGETVVKAMLDRFKMFYTDDVKKLVENSGQTLDDIIIIAAMVESEIMIPEERPIASGVIYNRLKIDMPLQIDSTVQYALGTRNEQVTLNDLEVESPYNTYKNTGLPYGPISNPGEAAINAAITPDDNNYLYYVVEAGGNGSHVYTETYDEFLKAKEKYKNQN